MKHHRAKPLVVLLALSFSGLGQAQVKTSEERWFPQQPQRPVVSPKQDRVDMPDIAPLSAVQCSGATRPFEVGGMQRSRGLAGRSDAAAETHEADRAVASLAPLGSPPAMATAPAPSAAPPMMASKSAMAENSVPAPTTMVRPRPAQDAPLRAGFVDDNADFSGFLSFLGKKSGTLNDFRARDVSERHGLDVLDAKGRPVQGAVVYMDVGVEHPRFNIIGRAMPTNMNWKPVAVSDVNGKAWVFPKAVTSDSGPYRLTVGYGHSSRNVTLEPSRKARTQVNLDIQSSQEVPRLDLSIVIDTTGSMSDEIRKLQKTLTQVVGEIERQGVDVCVNVTAYRDVHDAYVLKGIDFTSNLGAVQEFVNGLRADGGGDEPEALNQALEHVVNQLSWRKQDNVVRSVMLITDAPPKMDTGPIFYDRSMLAAGARGIRVHSVGTSGLNVDGGELVLRQVAQYTGGKFVFLTYKNAAKPASGAGDATVHDVQNYSVDTLDDLLLRLVKDDLGVHTQKRR